MGKTGLCLEILKRYSDIVDVVKHYQQHTTTPDSDVMVNWSQVL